MSDNSLIFRILFNMGSGFGAGIYAWKNRYGVYEGDIPLQQRFGEFYNIISPYIDHFCMGYATTSLAYTASNFSVLTADYQDPGNLIVKIPITAMILFDLAWERYRNRLSKGRFIATWAGILDSTTINNLEYLVNL